MNNTPAILGGQPLFTDRVPMVRPVLPAFEEISESIQEILRTGMVTKGPYLARFEAAVAQHLGVKHAVAVSSCTSGLMLSQKCLGLSGEVVVPSFTFMASVSSLVWNGLRPVFADVNRETTNLDPDSAEAAITPHTSAILAVHNFGNPAEIDRLQQIADRHGLKLIFDAAHGFGACYQGSPVGGQGNAQAFSLSPTKLLITGEGGIVSTNDDELAHNLRMGREYGNDGNYDSAFAGLNARMPELNALIGYHSLLNLENAARSRNDTVAIFHEVLGQVSGVGFQEVLEGNRNSYREFSITLDQAAFGLTRDQLVAVLTAENIDSRKYYDPPVHKQTAYRPFYNGAPLPNTDFLADNSISLPMWTNMSNEVALKIAEAIRRAQQNAPSIRRKFNAD